MEKKEVGNENAFDPFNPGTKGRSQIQITITDASLHISHLVVSSVLSFLSSAFLNK